LQSPIKPLPLGGGVWGEVNPKEKDPDRYSWWDELTTHKRISGTVIFKNFSYTETSIKWASNEGMDRKLLTILKKYVGESGGKWIIFSYFSIFIGKKRVWPHL
jgi:hypothetical protein